MKARNFILILLGFWIGVTGQDAMYFFQLTDPEDVMDLFISSLMIIFNLGIYWLLVITDREKEDDSCE